MHKNWKNHASSQPDIFSFLNIKKILNCYLDHFIGNDLPNEAMSDYLIKSPPTNFPIYNQKNHLDSIQRIKLQQRSFQSHTNLKKKSTTTDPNRNRHLATNSGPLCTRAYYREGIRGCGPHTRYIRTRRIGFNPSGGGRIPLQYVRI